MDKNQSVLNYYKKFGEITNLDNFKDFTDWLSPDVRMIFQITQGLILHDFWPERYGLKTKDIPKRNYKITYMEEILNYVLKADSKSLAIPRSPEKRIARDCRDFATLFCAFLQSKNIPARARCGFAVYLANPGFYEDHWVCEYWNGKRWIMVDPQIDPFQQCTIQNWAKTQKKIDPKLKKLLLNFNPLDVKPGKDFITAGQAWNMVKNNNKIASKFGVGADPKKYKLKSLYGLWFIRGNLLRDFASLNKFETEPFLNKVQNGKNEWQDWRLVSVKDNELSSEDWELLDKIATFSTNPDLHFKEIRNTFRTNVDLQVPESLLKKS